MILLPVSENRMIVASFVSTQYQRVTEDRYGRSYTAVALQAVRIRCNNVNPREHNPARCHEFFLALRVKTQGQIHPVLSYTAD